MNNIAKVAGVSKPSYFFCLKAYGSQMKNSFGEHTFAQHPKQMTLTSYSGQIRNYHMVCSKGVSGAQGRKRRELIWGLDGEVGAQS